MSELHHFLNAREIALKEGRENLVSYLLQKVKNDTDYHAVADAAMDVREIDAQLKMIEEVRLFLSKCKEER